MGIPQISVVMSVYNDATTLPETLESVLRQEDVDFEFIVINDGSSDASGAILDNYAAQDSRVKVIHQENTGLTRALICGCAEARGKFVARQDAGDISLPARLKIQADFLKKHPETVLVSCGTRFVGPKGELLYDIMQSTEEAEQGLHKLSLREIRGPSHHGSTMFRRSDYLEVGGYRAPFRVAQDLDLWLRLVERGRHVALPQTLYQAKLMGHSISGIQRKEQLQMTELIIGATFSRRRGGDESTFLQQASKISFNLKNNKKLISLKRANTYYFIARCLAPKDTDMEVFYYHQALMEFPLHLKSLLRLLLHKVRT